MVTEPDLGADEGLRAVVPASRPARGVPEVGLGLGRHLGGGALAREQGVVGAALGILRPVVLEGEDLVELGQPLGVELLDQLRHGPV